MLKITCFEKYKIKLRFKLKSVMTIGVVTILIISNILIAVMFSNFFRELVEGNIKAAQMSNIVKLIDIIDLKLEYQSQIARSISSNDKIQNIVLSPTSSLLIQVTNNRDVKKLLWDYSGSLDGIYSVNLFTKNYSEPLNNIMVGKYADDVAPYGVNDYSVFEKYVLNNSLYKYKNNVFFNICTDKSLGSPMLTTLKWITDSKDKKVGVLTILLRLDFLFSNIEAMKSNSASNLYIIDNSGSDIYNSNYTKISKKFDDFPFLQEILKMKDGNLIKKAEGKDYILTFKHFDSIDWTVVEITPYNELLKDFNLVKTKIVFSILGLTCVIAIIALFLSNSVTLGLKRLLSNIETIKSGNLTTNIGTSSISEIEELNVNFTEMMDKIKNLLDEIEYVSKKEREFELKALQAQINPHFLYNTLDAVYWMTDDKDAAEIISNLGKFFRLSLSKGLDMVPVVNELEQVRKYVEIQMKIYRNRFEYIEEIDENIKNYKVIKLILQPLVENSIIHGLNEKKTNGQIKLTVTISGETLIFTVEDNGMGVDIEELNSIFNNTNEPKGYGIKNVNDRIKLKYGNNYGLYYENKVSGGTIAKIIVPLTM